VLHLAPACDVALCIRFRFCILRAGKASDLHSVVQHYWLFQLDQTDVVFHYNTLIVGMVNDPFYLSILLHSVAVFMIVRTQYEVVIFNIGAASSAVSSGEDEGGADQGTAAVEDTPFIHSSDPRPRPFFSVHSTNHSRLLHL